MNKKFITGMIFGLALGLGVGATTPMLGAKNIVINKPKANPQTNTSINSSQPVASGDNANLKALQELNATMKENNDQNRQIIQELNNLNKKGGLGG